LKKLLVTISNRGTTLKNQNIGNIGAEVPKVPKDRSDFFTLEFKKIQLKEKLTGLCTAG